MSGSLTSLTVFSVFFQKVRNWSPFSSIGIPKPKQLKFFQWTSCGNKPNFIWSLKKSKFSPCPLQQGWTLWLENQFRMLDFNLFFWFFSGLLFFNYILRKGSIFWTKSAKFARLIPMLMILSFGIIVGIFQWNFESLYVQIFVLFLILFSTQSGSISPTLSGQQPWNNWWPI